jgi:hypothetical protein
MSRKNVAITVWVDEGLDRCLTAAVERELTTKAQFVRKALAVAVDYVPPVRRSSDLTTY